MKPALKVEKLASTVCVLFETKTRRARVLKEYNEKNRRRIADAISTVRGEDTQIDAVQKIREIEDRNIERAWENPSPVKEELGRAYVLEQLENELRVDS